MLYFLGLNVFTALDAVGAATLLTVPSADLYGKFS